MRPTIIFDFDGTVADSFKMAIAIAQTLLEKHGYPAWTEEKIQQMRELSAAQLIKAVKISPRHLPAMARYVRKEQKNRIHTVEPVAGMTAALQTLTKHYNLAIVSSTEAYLIEEFLLKHKLSACVEDVIGGAGIFQKHRSIKRFMKQKNLDRSSVLYVGDEVRDVDAARKAKIPVISVTWGFNGQRVLQKAQPDKLAVTPDELVAAISEVLPI